MSDSVIREHLTIKDLNCGNCTRPLGKPDGTDDCPLSIPAHLDVAVVHCIEIIGCASHPLAQQVIARPPIEELEGWAHISAQSCLDTKGDSLFAVEIGALKLKFAELLKGR